MILRLLRYALVSLGLAGVADAAHSHGSPGPSAAQGRAAELGASAAFAADGALWAVHKISGHIAVSRSDDEGRSWSNPTLVTPSPEPTDTGADARPKIAFGEEGEVYLTWTRPLAKPYTGEIHFTRSLDRGRTFAPSIVVHRDRQEITHRFDALAVGAKGDVFVAWIDKRDLLQAEGAGREYRGAAVYFAVSTDRGATFRGDFKIADHACECCRISVVASEDGGAIALWRHIFPPNIRDHALATLGADGTAAPLERATFDDWAIDGCPHHGPALAVTGGSRHAVWFAGGEKRRGVFYGKLDRRGAEEPRRIGTELARHADIAVDGAAIAVAWKVFDQNRAVLRGLVSGDHGKTWQERDLASVDGASDHPRVLTRRGRFFVFWHTKERPLSVTRLE